MVGRSKTRKARARARDGGTFAVELAQDKKFRKELLSALGHGAIAQRRARSRIGTAATLRRLVADDALRDELAETKKHLERARSRFEKKRSHRWRNILLVAGAGAALAAIPQTRKWIGARLSSLRGGPRVISETIEVDVPVTTAYNQWTQFEDFPTFMDGVEEVRQLDDTRLHWVVNIGGRRAEWDAKILEQHPDRQISWISEDGKATRGTVTFEELGPSRTRVGLSMSYTAEGAGEALGSAMHLDERRVKEDLRRFKDMIEARDTETGAWRGEVVAGQTS